MELTDLTIMAIFAGVLAAIVYSLRVLVLMERRIARIEIHIENLASRILSEELKIEREEKLIETELKPKAQKKAAKKKKKKK